MDRRELEIMLNEAFDRGIVSVGHLVHETVEVGFLNELGRTVGFTLNGWKEAIETIPVDLFDSFDDGRGRERFLSDCKALGGKVPQNTYRGELVSALADVLMVEEAAPALGALESALDSARRKGYCVFDRGVHGDVPADGLVYLCSTYPAAVGLKDSLDSVRAQGNGPDTRTLGVYRMVDGYCIMGGLDSVSQADAYAVDADLAEGWGVGDAAFRIADLKAKTFSYAVEAGEDPGLHRRRRPEGRRVLGSREAVARQGRRRCPRGLEGLRAPTLIPWGVRMRPQALWHTHANAQPRIRTYPCIRIRIYA